MAPGWVNILVVVVLFVLLFGGRGKISSIMGDMGKGISSFKKGIKEGAEDPASDAINVTPAADPIKVKPAKK